MKINGAKLENGELVFSVPLYEARRFLATFEVGEYDIVPAKKKRSLDANAYCWVLCNKIAYAVRESPENVYRDALKNIPDVCEVLCAPKRAVEGFKRVWLKGHIGRRVDVEPSKLPGCMNMYVYYGSSDFDTKQMSLLIDNLIQDAHTLGIETRTDEEIKSLLEAWK